MASTSKLALSSAAITTTTTSAAKSLESNATAFIAFIDVSVQGGASTTTAKIQHSPDGNRWIDLASFTPVVNTTGFEAVQVTVGVFPNIRSVVTMSGATPTATVAVSLWFDPSRG